MSVSESTPPDGTAGPANVPLLAGGAFLLAAAALIGVMQFSGADQDVPVAADPEATAVAAEPAEASVPDGWDDVDIDLSEVVIEASGVPALTIGDPSELTLSALDDRIDADGHMDVNVGVTTAAVEDGRFVSYWSAPADMGVDGSVDTTDVATRYARAVAAAAGSQVDPVTGPPRPRLSNPDGDAVQVGWDLEVRYRYLLNDGPDAWVESLTGTVTVAGDGTVVAWDLPLATVTATDTTFDAADGAAIIEMIADGGVLAGSSPPPSGTFRARHAALITSDGTDWRWVLSTSDTPGAGRVIVNATESL